MSKLLKKYSNHTSFYLNPVCYYAGLVAVIFFITSYFLPVFYTLAVCVLAAIALLILIDTFLLYSGRNFFAKRTLSHRFSNGDENTVKIEWRNDYPFAVKVKLIDELPYQFQIAAEEHHLDGKAESGGTLTYSLRPVERGDYHFGNINAYVQSPMRIISRRYEFAANETVIVYPSFIQARKYRLLAVANRLQEAGVKRLRRLGHSLEFEQIKEYVRGDDYRSINWKATARKDALMSNTYTDERSQQVYCLINKGRTMKMPFDGMTLLDYSINSALVVSNVALARQDKAGLITFSQSVDTFLPADKKPGQINMILESLYSQQTNFMEIDFEKLYRAIRHRITNRSLLILYTNFLSIESLQREMPSLKLIAHYHLLVVVFFENVELKEFIQKDADTIEDIYIKTIAEKYTHEKKLMVKELHKNGIVAILTEPSHLTVDVLNKYLEIKNRQTI